MPEFTEGDVTRLAEMMARYSAGAMSWDEIARDLLARGVTPPPPPDPAVVVSDYLYVAAAGGPVVGLRSAVRDLFTPEALQDAAAKVQEAQS